VDVGGAENNIASQAAEAVRFIRASRAELIRTRSYPGVEHMTLDFATVYRDVVVQSERLPADLVAEAASVGMEIEISFYPPPEEESLNMMSQGSRLPRQELRFEVDHVLKRDVVIILARQITPGNFTLDAHSTFGDCAIKPIVSMPRAIDREGQPRKDVFAFTLSKRTDAAKFAKGRVVTLATNMSAEESA